MAAWGRATDPNPDQTLAVYQRALVKYDHQIRLLRNVKFWYLAPMYVGLLTGSVGLLKEHAEKGTLTWPAALYPLFYTLLFAAVWWLNEVHAVPQTTRRMRARGHIGEPQKENHNADTSQGRIMNPAMNLNRRSFLQTGAAFAAGQIVKAAPNERITVGHIGAGARAHELMQAVMANPNTEIVGVVDAYTGRVERAIDRTGRPRQGVSRRTTTCWPINPSTRS